MKPLSFLIITYNRSKDLLELLQNLTQLENAENLLEEIIVVNNASTEDYINVKDFIVTNTNFPFKYFDAPENLGVARGRNYGLIKGTAPIIIMLDDDAVLQNKNCLNNLIDLFNEKKEGRETAIISFKVLYFDTLEMQKNALPHKNYSEFKDKSFFETYYYAGGAHAIKRKVLKEVGNYPEDFFYGMEEYDLSYRIINAGYRIVYSDKIVMLHKESPLGRKPKEEKIRMMWINKTKVAHRYLPKKYFYSTSFLWSLFYLYETKCNLKGFLKGWKEISIIKKNVIRKPISINNLKYIIDKRARLYY